MTRCEECGFVYDLSEAEGAAAAIVDGVRDLIALLGDGDIELTTRGRPDIWSPLEYGCHVRDVLLVQRERVLATLWMDVPTFNPMGRDERVELDGYVDQDPEDVTRQLTDAAAMLANVFARMSGDAWERTLTYSYPANMVRSLRWVAVHTVHEVRHHTLDVRRQLAPAGG